MYENIKENIKDTVEPSSLERIKEEENASTEPSSLKLTTLKKSFKILIILIKEQIIKDERRNLLFIM